MVGAVIVKDGKIIGEGYHKKYGELHAERNAIASLTESAEGAVIYVTLEPCCHHGKTPPCTEAIIEQKIRKVVIGSRDPNPKVAGKGVQMLREAGVTVVEDFMREECDQLNPVFFHYITTKTPYVVMKYAMTLDGKIATKTGASKWITGEAARKEVTTAFRAVESEFKEKTGFSLNVEYHNQDENGANDDEVDGGFYFLLFDEVYQERPEATALNEIVPFGLRYYVNQG